MLLSSCGEPGGGAKMCACIARFVKDGSSVFKKCLSRAIRQKASLDWVTTNEEVKEKLLIL